MLNFPRDFPTRLYVREDHSRPAHRRLLVYYNLHFYICGSLFLVRFRSSFTYLLTYTCDATIRSGDQSVAGQLVDMPAEPSQAT